MFELAIGASCETGRVFRVFLALPDEIYTRHIGGFVVAQSILAVLFWLYHNPSQFLCLVAVGRFHERVARLGKAAKHVFVLGLLSR